MHVAALILVNIRSLYNVGAILRTAEGLGVRRVIGVGYTPLPQQPDDHRPPYIIARVERELAKTALGAEKLLELRSVATWADATAQVGPEPLLCALEQSPTAVSVADFQTDRPLALVVGPEVTGLDPALVAACDVTIEIPMQGQKESFNVSVATGIALYALLHHS